MNIKRNLLFCPDKEAGKVDGKLRCRVSWNGGSVAFGVGYRVEFDKWSKDTQRCKNSTTHGKNKVQSNIINREVQRFEATINKLFIDYENADIMPTPAQFREAFNVAIGKQKTKVIAPVSLFDIFDQFIASEGVLNSWSYSMTQKFGTFRNHLFTFNPYLTFEALSVDVLAAFVDYQHELDLYNTSIDKNLRYLRWFLRWAVRNGHYSGNVHEVFRPRLKGIDGANREVIHLSWDELMLLYGFDFNAAEKEVGKGKFEPLPEETKKALTRVRDVFCFCCFTGLRYSDVAKLTKGDVRDNCIYIVTQKTTDALKIELNKYSRALLAKYEFFEFPKRLALPVISNQKMNDQLKVACEIVGFKTPQRIVYYKGNKRIEDVFPKYAVITTHTGRRTFIVNALFLGIHESTIMKWTGHKNFTSMKPYMKIVDDLKSREMAKFDTQVPDKKKGD